MKLRQKLVAVLAASMVMTSIPVVTMADTTNAVRNVNQILKDSEMGYKTDDYTGIVTDITHTPATTSSIVSGSRVILNNSSAANYGDRYIPAFEFVPKADYETGAQKQSFFISLSKDTSFNDDALLTAINIAAADGITLNNSSDLSVNAKFDSYEDFEAQKTANTNNLPLIFKDGKVVQSNIPAWYGKTVSEIMAANPTLTINYDGSTLTIEHISDLNIKENDREYQSTLRIDVKGTWDQGDVVKVPLLAKAGGDDVVVRVDGLDSFISSGTYVITGKLTDKRLSASADTETLTTDGGEIGKITLSESQIHGLSEGTNRYIRLSLPSSSDLEFVEGDVKVTGARGFYSKSDTIEAKYDTQYRNSSQEDTKAIIMELPDWYDDTARGNIELTGIKVVPEGKLADAGDVNITLEEYTGELYGAPGKEDKLVAETTLKVATIKDYEVTLTCDKPVSIKAGRSGLVNDKTATFVLEESVKDSLVDSRKIEFKLENGYFFGPADVDYNANSSFTSKTYEQAAEDTFRQLVQDKVIKFEEKAEDYEVSSLNLDIDAEGKVYGFTARFPKLDSDKADKLKITAPIATDVQSKGDVTLKVSNLYTRYTEKDEISCVVANIVEPIAVDIDKAAIKVGLQGQEAGKITIKETDKGMLERGWLFLSAADVEGITFAKMPTITTSPSDSSGLTITNMSLSKDKTVVAMEITKTSKDAATIEISDLVFTADRTVPEASYGLEIWGTALTDENELNFTNLDFTKNVLNAQSYKYQYTDSYIVKDFIQITTPNTEDIKNGALKAVTSVFTIGANSYKVDGVEQSMDAPVYIKEGRTMVPVRYLAYAFGLDTSNVLYGNSTATIIAGEKIIQVTVGSDIMTVNGSQVKMDTKAELKDGRAYVPMKFIAAALGVTSTWDSATQTATFSNVAK